MTTVLALDSGAARAGWSVLANRPPEYIDSGVVHTPRGANEAFQTYRMRLTDKWVGLTLELLYDYHPDVIVTETVPALGANNGTQLYLANVQITVVHAIAVLKGVPVEQVSARTVQAEIAIRGKGKKITKPQVRNGVFARLPELQPRFSEFTKVFEGSDALAIGLHYLEK